MTRAEVLERLRAHRPALAERFGVVELAVFGSFARDEATDESDLDILVRFEHSPELASLLRRPVLPGRPAATTGGTGDPGGRAGRNASAGGTGGRGCVRPVKKVEAGIYTFMT